MGLLASPMMELLNGMWAALCTRTVSVRHSSSVKYSGTGQGRDQQHFKPREAACGNKAVMKDEKIFMTHSQSRERSQSAHAI